MHMWEGSKTNTNDSDNFFVAGGVINAKLVRADNQWKVSELGNTVVLRAGSFKNITDTK